MTVDGIGRSLSVSCMAETACGAGVGRWYGAGPDLRPETACCSPLLLADRQTLDSGLWTVDQGQRAWTQTTGRAATREDMLSNRGPPRVGNVFEFSLCEDSESEVRRHRAGQRARTVLAGSEGPRRV